MIWNILVYLALFRGVQGLYEDIDDITNNLATDLAPLVTLFGEQATKQFLSESTSFMDSIIFSIAPLGLITAVVSVIRIYGSSSFKSIIGRSQEAHGLAEAELCSSTSQDVCELWSNGSICRVFGRPKILDFIHESGIKEDFYPKYRKDLVEIKPSCGIYRPNLLLGNQDEQVRQKLLLFNWKEVSPSPLTWRKLMSRHSEPQPQDTRTKDEPSANPNLTLNIGMSKVSKTLQWSVLIFGVLVQLSFFGYATWATFYNPSFLNEGTPSPQAKLWFALTISGTLMLVCGMTLCARMIDLKSSERRFKKIGGTPKIFWLQPGGQRIGDQLFHAFAYSENKDYYITSSRLEDTHPERTLLLAVISTTLGWVLQFVGLRGSPGSVALFQFIATLIMSLLRAVLRGKRLGADGNRLKGQIYKNGNRIEGHELDWQAMNIDENDRHNEWHLSDHLPSEDQHDYKNKIPEGVTVKSTQHLRAYYTMDDDLATNAANCASEWVASQEAQHAPSLNAGAKIMRFRSRLAELTGVQSGLPPEQAWNSETRTTALQLQKALQVSAEYIFAQFPLDLAWINDAAPKAIAWKSSCWFPRLPDQTSQEKPLAVGFQMHNRDGKWSISSCQLEAVLGLWSWSLKRSELLLGPTAEQHLIRSKMVIVEDSKRDDIEAALYLWVTQTRKVRQYGTVDGISRPDNLSIPTSSLLGRAQSSRQSSGARGQTHAPSTSGYTLLGIPTNENTSLLQLMAQDIYTVFVNRIVDIVGDCRGTGSPKDYLTLPYHSLSIGSQATLWLGLSNPHIDALANALSSAGVATQEEALMSIIPSFLQKMKLPLLEDDVVESLLDRAKSFRRDSKFRDGAAVIIWVLSRYPARFYRRALRCLGDLYRRAAQSTKGIDQSFGLTGMRDMKNCHPALASNRDTQGILTCYGEVYRSFNTRRSRMEEFDYGKFERSLEGYMESSRPKPTTDLELKRLEYALIMNDRYSLTSIRQDHFLQLLTWAIKNNIPELIEDFWPNAASPKDQWGHSPVPVALEHNCDLETFNSLLDWPKMGIDAVGGESALGDIKTPLIYAVEANRVDVVLSILRRGASLQQRDRVGMTPLHHAAHKSNEATIQFLLDKGADIHERDGSDRMGLHLAAMANSEAIVQFLLDKGAGVHEKDNWGKTALHFAAEQGDEAVILLLLEKGAGRHEKCTSGRTVLHSAAKARGEAVIRLLLAYGAKIHEKDYSGQTVLHLAVRWENHIIIQFLLENGVDVHQKDNKGRTSLHYAAAMGQNKNIIAMLIDNGADIHVKDEEGKTPLHCAAACQGEEIIQLLLQKGASVYEKDINGQTALHIAAQKGSERILRLLLENQAENGSAGDLRWSSLWSVIRKDDEEVAKVLRENNIESPSGIDGQEEGKTDAENEKQ